jgi:hypothetical protein
LLGLYECFRIFGGEIGKGSLPLPLKKDEKSMKGGKNGSEGGSACLMPVEACR